MKKQVLFITLVLFVLLGFVETFDVSACTIIAVGKKASKDSSVMVSHTDCGPDSRIYVVKGRTFKKGAKAPVYWGIQDLGLPLKNDGEILGYIPQVKKTYTYFHSAYSHCNEHQLAIAESTTAQKEELIAMITKKNRPNQIMTIEQAQIFALQRCKKSKDAVKLIGDLMTKYGFLSSSGDGSETLAIADTEEIWIMEIFGVGKNWSKDGKKPGAIWAAHRLAQDRVSMIPNWSIINEIDVKDTKNFMVSKNYMQEAIDRGWYDPASKKPFNWQATYAPIPVEYATSRFWLFYSTFAPHLKKWPNRTMKLGSHKCLNQYFQSVEPVSLYPFSVVPEHKLSVHDIIAFQRSTFEGTIYDITMEPQWLVSDGNGGFKKSPLATPFPGSDMKKLLKLTNRRPVARHRGHYGMVSQLRGWLPDEIGGIYWVYLDNPYISPYIPIYFGNLSIDKSYNIYNPKKYQKESARWAIDFVDNLAKLKFQSAIKDIWKVRKPFEDKIFENMKNIEKEALKRHKRSVKSAKKYLTNYSNNLMKQVVKMYYNLRNELIVKYTNNNE